MNHRAALVFVGLALAVAGCAGKPAKPLTAEEASAAPTAQLCWRYGEFGKSSEDASAASRRAIRAELRKRGAIDDGEWQLVDRQTIEKGVHRCAVLAVFGNPTADNQSGNGIEVLSFTADNALVTLRDGAVVAFLVGRS
jgi:hypothetical protein